MKLNIKVPEGMQVEEKEIEAYIKHIKKRYPNRDIEYLNIKINNDGYADLEYKLAPTKFERIRRITGYLTGDTKTWNNAKQAELRDRKKHL